MPSHSHWPMGYHTRPKSNCKLTKAECDKLWTAYLHFHEGKPCETMEMPGYKKPVCIAGLTPEQIEAKLSKRGAQESVGEAGNEGADSDGDDEQE